MLRTEQQMQLKNPDARIVVGAFDRRVRLLNEVATPGKGSTTGDSPHYHRFFWELLNLGGRTVPWLDSPKSGDLWSGRQMISVVPVDDPDLLLENGCRIHGQAVWKRPGVAVSKMSDLRPFLYAGEVFDDNVGVLCPEDATLIPAILCYCESAEYAGDIRAIDQAIKVTAATLAKVAFDAERWRNVAEERYPDGLPPANSSDPSQWLFGGHPKGAYGPLQVAVARLVGYRWPRQTGSSFPDCPTLGPDGLERNADIDGIVPLMALKGEAGAAERLVALLQDAYASEWSAAKLVNLLTAAEAANSSLEDWLLDKFFDQHCVLFYQRPFVWHIWDGRRDGFNVLVNYHRLTAGNGEGKRLLEKLTHTYLGDWFDLQRRDSAAGVEGADARLAAAAHLKGELEKILAGAPPYDLFVRWKPLCEQAIGWEPDINDGIRLNIRPFMMARPFGARATNACILRATPRIKWEKDRGKEPNRPKEDFPWFWGWDEATQDFTGGDTFDGKRWNDLHYTNKAKGAAREARSRSD